MLELPGTCIEIHEKDPAVEGDEGDQGTWYFETRVKTKFDFSDFESNLSLTAINIVTKISVLWT